MLQLAIMLLLLALVTGVASFGGLMPAFTDAGQLLFFVFVGLFLATAAASAFRRRPRV